MFMQHFRFYIYPLNARFLVSNRENTKFLMNQLYRTIFCHPHINLKGSVRSLLPESILSKSFKSSVCRNFKDIKYYNVLNSDIESLAVSKSDTSPALDGGSIVINDQNRSLENEMKQSDIFEDIDYEKITEGDEDKLNQFKLLMLEIDVMRQDGRQVPSKMSINEWKELFHLPSRSQRWKYLKFLFKNEMKKLADKRKKELKRLAKLESLEEDTSESLSDHLRYGFRGSTIFIRIYEQSINFYDNYRLIRAMMLGQDLIVDCGYYNDMNNMENKLCAKQMVILFAENRLSKDPFNIHFVNVDKNTIFYQHLKKTMPKIEEPDYPINLYEEHYLDLFPKEKLVYLTPHCHTELKEFNPDDIYIVGAIVDKVNTAPLSLAKAKSEGLKMAKFPLDRYLDWSIGNKSLTINQVVNILQDAMLTRDWNVALKHVPRRKIRQPDTPIRDPRKTPRRGTTFQPPERLIKKYY